MGEITEMLKDRRDRLLQKKAFIQNFDMAALNAQITKLNQLITLIEQAGG